MPTNSEQAMFYMATHYMPTNSEQAMFYMATHYSMVARFKSSEVVTTYIEYIYSAICHQSLNTIVQMRLIYNKRFTLNGANIKHF